MTSTWPAADPFTWGSRLAAFHCSLYLLDFGEVYADFFSRLCVHEFFAKLTGTWEISYVNLKESFERVKFAWL